MKKKFISLMLVVSMLATLITALPITVSAKASGTCGDNLTWTLDDEGTLTISGTGDMHTSYGDQEYASSNVKNVVVKSGVTSIGNYAFYGCTNLTSITIPNSVTSVGDYAFWICENLINITIPDSVTDIGYGAFLACHNLKCVTMSKSVTSIGDYAFEWCGNLTSIILPDTIANIRNGAFLYCYSLKDIYYTGSEENWNKISIELNNECLTNATIHYNYHYDSNDENDNIPTTISEFEIDNGYCIENDTNSLLGSIEILGGSKTINDIKNEIVWKSSDDTIAEIKNVSYVNSADEKSALIGVDIIGHKIGKVTITGTTKNGDKAEAVVSVEPKLNKLNYGTIFSPAAIEYEISTESDNKEYFEEFVSSLTYDISAVFSTGISVTSTEYKISSDGKKAVYIINVTPTLNLTVNTIKLKSAYGQTADIDVRVQKKNGFSIKNDGWSFANSEYSFSGQVMREGKFSDFKNEYTMPIEIYEQVFGNAYISANNITTGELFGGYCQGMSDTAILFYDELLKWYDIDNLYDESFNTVNSYYDAISYYKESSMDSKQYYVTSNPSSEVTRLIECYQLWGNHVGNKSPSSTYHDIDKTYFKELYSSDKINKMYEHISSYENGGIYVSNALERIKQAVVNDTPLLIGLYYQTGGHAIVARTDKMPEDMGNGWWKVFVYNPNNPYINDDILSQISNKDKGYKLLQSNCNKLLNEGNDDYMELNPSKNLWRYHTSLTSGSTEDLIGCNENETIKMMIRTDEVDGQKYSLSFPEYFSLSNPKEYFAGTFKNPDRSWLPSENENTITVPISEDTDLEIYSTNYELLAKTAKGYGVSFNDDIYFLPYVNSDFVKGSITGELVIPKDKYQIKLNSGNIKIWGHSNVISLDASAGVSATIDIVNNKIDLTSEDNNNIVLLMSDIGDADEYDTYKMVVKLKENDNIIAELSEDEPIKITNNTNETIATFHKNWRDIQKNQIILTIGKTEAQVFGETKVNDVAPIIRNDRTMLPARFIAENLGADVKWDNDERKVTITKGNTTIIITIDSQTALVNGAAVVLDSPAFIENDRTYTPLRFIAEKLGASVEWAEKEQKVIITKTEIQK